MNKILVIGGGAMGSAFTIPCIDNNNKVTITEPYSKKFIKDLSSKSKFHSSLKINLSKKLKFRDFSLELLQEKFDLIVIALSLSGINFIGEKLKKVSISEFHKEYEILIYFGFEIFFIFSEKIKIIFKIPAKLENYNT